MQLAPRRLAAASLLLVTAACGDATDPDPEPGCIAPRRVTLAVGAAEWAPASGSGACIELPASETGAEYLLVAASGAGVETFSGVSAPYRWQGGDPAGSEALEAARSASPRHKSAAEEFHGRLRQLELELPVQSPQRRTSEPGAVANRVFRPVSVGESHTFQACATTDCNAFQPVQATARFVSSAIAVYTDDELAPADLPAATLDSLGAIFQELYGIDVAAFGAPSDLDANAVVRIVITRAVNRLLPCGSGSQVLGYFLPLDLSSGVGEVLYLHAPDPANPSCPVSTAAVVKKLPVAMVHELQHLISYGEHVLARGGSAETVWLNEALSHYAEELGGRLLAGSHFTQFVLDNLDRAYEYLAEPEASFLVSPGGSFGSVAERGAGWLFVRWLADHYGADSLGLNLTRRLVGTGRTGFANVAAETGAPFGDLVAMWQMALYADDLPEFIAVEPRLAFKSWNLRATYASLHAQDPGRFPRAYPLHPDSAGSIYLRTGTLRGGSARHLRVTQLPGGDLFQLRLSDVAGQPLPALIDARIGVVRLH